MTDWKHTAILEGPDGTMTKIDAGANYAFANRIHQAFNRLIPGSASVLSEPSPPLPVDGGK